MKRTFAVALTGAALVLTGCGGGSDSSNTSSTNTSAGSQTSSGSASDSSAAPTAAETLGTKDAKRDKELAPKSEVARRLLDWLNDG